MLNVNLNNSSLRNNLGKNSRQFIIDNFEEKKIVDQIQKKYMEWIK